MKERRYFKRVPFAAEVTVTTDGTKITGELYDISLKGVLVKLPAGAAPAVDDICTMGITLPRTDIVLAASTRVVHARSPFLGLRFTEMDADTLTHIRRLVELNTGAADRLNDELGHWLAN
ncbi:MAG: PilZ domain-containing protein [Deltaproteobacteria bacterium]|nr:PilZ domain-containing protein [Candidatus Anaeroferrophillacea bacterium]